MPKFRGTEIQLGDKAYILPALSLGQLRNGILDILKEHDELVLASKFYEAISLRAGVIHSALTRNYPDLPLSEVEDNLDLSNSSSIWLLVLGGSGFSGETPATTKETSGASGSSTEN